MAKSITIPTTPEQYEVIATLAKSEGVEITKFLHELVRQEAQKKGMVYQIPPARGKKRKINVAE